jgi:hypothetical protein
MPDLMFTHKSVPGTLVVDTGANDISWAYNLNTQAFPTYGGEVIQVLSANIDNITITGEVRSYAQMEQIYDWFLRYMQVATQGYRDEGGYDESPVLMQYPHRGWTMKIKPISLPQMRYGREVIVPEWQLEAAMVQPDIEQLHLTLDTGVGSLVSGDVDNFKKITGNVGYRIGNPFSDPHGLLTREEANLYYGSVTSSDLPEGMHVQGEKGADEVDTESSAKASQGLGKQMNDSLQKLLGGKFQDIFGRMSEAIGAEASKPITGKQSNVQDNG